MEKTLMKKKIASVGNVEAFLQEFEIMVEKLEDDKIKSESYSFIRDICVEREICEDCLTKVEEAYEFDNLIRSCECKPRYKNYRLVEGF